MLYIPLSRFLAIPHQVGVLQVAISPHFISNDCLNGINLHRHNTNPSTIEVTVLRQADDDGFSFRFPTEWERKEGREGCTARCYFSLVELCNRCKLCEERRL